MRSPPAAYAGIALAASTIFLPLLAGYQFEAYGQEQPDVWVKSFGVFTDSDGRQNIIGLVRNSDDVPVQAVLELTAEGAGNSTVLHEPMFAKKLFPETESPFKFVLPEGMEAKGDPIVIQADKVPVSNQDFLVLNYTNMGVGESRALVGTVKNTAPFEMYNISVYASVHNDKMDQIDSVETASIPILKPGEVAEFSVEPDPSVRADVLYYSCAGVDYDDPITTLKTADGGFIPYQLNALGKVSSFRYVEETDSISFGIQPYSPAGDSPKIRLAQTGENQTITVIVDGQPHEATVEKDGRTVTVAFFVPEGHHEVSIQGVRNVPEFPAIFGAVAAMTAFVVAVTRYRARKGSI